MYAHICPRNPMQCMHTHLHICNTHTHMHTCCSYTQDYCTLEFLRMSGVYWGLTAMDLMGQLHRMSKGEVLAFVRSCQHSSGGFIPAPHHDPHLLYTLSAIQVTQREYATSHDLLRLHHISVCQFYKNISRAKLDNSTVQKQYKCFSMRYNVVGRVIAPSKLQH